MSLEQLEDVAGNQFGLFSFHQAMENVTDTVLRYHSRPGRRWRRVAPCVYEVIGASRDWRRGLMAAQLWAGPDAVLTHDSAGALHDLDGVRRAAVHLTMPKSTRPPNGWTVHHRLIDLARVVASADESLRYTDALRTLADLAATLDEVRLEWVLESVLRQRLATLEEVSALAPGRGMARLRRVLSARGPVVRPTGSVLETRFVQAARTVDVPPLERQVSVDLGPGFGRVYLDLAWPDLGVFIEIDGHWHDEDEVPTYDRNRQNEIVIALGWRPLRYGSDSIRRHPRYVARRLETAYRRASSGAWDGAGYGSGARRAIAATAR